MAAPHSEDGRSIVNIAGYPRRAAAEELRPVLHAKAGLAADAVCAELVPGAGQRRCARAILWPEDDAPTRSAGSASRTRCRRSASRTILRKRCTLHRRGTYVTGQCWRWTADASISDARVEAETGAVNEHAATSGGCFCGPSPGYGSIRRGYAIAASFTDRRRLSPGQRAQRPVQVDPRQPQALRLLGAIRRCFAQTAGRIAIPSVATTEMVSINTERWTARTRAAARAYLTLSRLAWFDTRDDLPFAEGTTPIRKAPVGKRRPRLHSLP